MKSNYLAIFAVILTIALPIEVYGKGRITKIPFAGTLLNDIDSSKTHKVPFAGILLDEEAWGVVLKEKELHKKEMELQELEHLRDALKKEREIQKLKIELDWAKKTNKERLEIKDRYAQRLEEMIKEDADEINWVPWAFVGGVVIGAAAAIGIAFAVK